MKAAFFLLSIVILALGIPFIIGTSFNLEGFSNYSLNNAMGEVPSAETSVLVQDTYPAIGKNQISNMDAQDIWREMPIFKVGSYAQITNNIRYPENPDDGTCTPASMCNALYKNKFIKSNYITPLPPISPDCGTRVGYFSTEPQIITSLPYRTSLSNILY